MRRPATGHRSSLPPLTFGYIRFDPAGRRFEPFTGPALPTGVAGRPDPGAGRPARASGCPTCSSWAQPARYWRNPGGGRFDRPRSLAEAPPLRWPTRACSSLDADGDGRPDLLVTATGGRAGRVLPADASAPAGAGGPSSRYRQAPAVSLADPAVRLVDLNGDGLTDVLRSGTRLDCWFNDPDPERAWQRNAAGHRHAARSLDLADPRVRLADMTGDGLQDIVLLRSGNIAYWPNLGHGRWGAP